MKLLYTALAALMAQAALAQEWEDETALDLEGEENVDEGLLVIDGEEE